MRQLPFLIIALTLVIIAAALIYAGVTYANAPVQQQAEYIGRATVVGFSGAFFSSMIVGALCFCLWIAALIHLLTTKTIQGTDKIVWTIILVFLSVIGAALYFLLRPYRTPISAATPPAQVPNI